MRLLNIINDLVESKDYLPLEYFVNKHSISKRTLQNEFSYLSNAGKDKGFYLIQKRGRGYLLEVQDEDKFSKFIEELDIASNIPKVSSENIIAYVAIKDEYETRENLIKIFQVSKSNLKSYGEEIDIYLNNYNLEMERRAHYGLKIVGDPINKRKLLIDLYTKENQIVKAKIEESLGANFKEVQDSLVEGLKRNDVIINYAELKEIVIWLKVTTFIHLQSSTPRDKTENIKFINEINKQYGVGLGDTDINEVLELIKGKSRVKNEDKDYLKNIESDITKFLIEIDKSNKTHFNEDEDFKKLLITHVAALVNRLTLKISYTNPIIDEISIKYPMIFNIAIALGDILEKNYQIKTTKDEIGFIATYFILHMEKEILFKLKKYKRIAIVCSSGGGSSYLIKLKLETLFSDSDIETFSIIEINKVEEYKPDIIFSITDVNINKDIPVVYVKELLDDYDILNIKQLIMFEKFNNVVVTKTKEYYLKRFFDPMYFSIDDTSIDYIECLKEMSLEIEEDNIGGNNYSENVLKREEYTPTIYLNGVAIPHPIEMKGNKDLISVKILKNPIIYKNKKVSIIFMISLCKSSLEFHKGITGDLFEIMNDLEKIQRILKVKSFKEFMVLINK